METIPEDAGPPIHIHHRGHALFTVLSGAVKDRCGDVETPLGAGGGAMLPPGAGADFGRHVSADGLKPPADIARITELAARYGLECIGPPID